MGISSAFETIKRTGDSISSKFNSIRSGFESAVGTYTGTFGNDLKNGTMTGINYQGASAINEAIENWLSKIDSDLDAIQDIETNGAFKGEQFTAAISDFVLAVKETCHNVSSNLREFQDILNRAIVQYKERDEQLKSDISSSSETVRSQASEREQVSHQG